MGAWNFVDRKIEAHAWHYAGHRCKAAPRLCRPRRRGQPGDRGWRRCTPRSRPRWSHARCPGLSSAEARNEEHTKSYGRRHQGAHVGRERHHRDGGAMAEEGRLIRAVRSGRAAGGAGDRQGHRRGERAQRGNARCAGRRGRRRGRSRRPARHRSRKARSPHPAPPRRSRRPPPASASAPAKPAAAAVDARCAGAPHRLRSGRAARLRRPADVAAHAPMPSAAKRMAENNDLSPQQVGAGTGKDGRITKGDVLAFMSRPAQP